MENLSSQFLSVFNEIEKHLRRLTGTEENHIGFTALLRNAAPLRWEIRRYKETLKEINDLRKVLVHSHSDSKPVATPFSHTVEHLKLIHKTITSPPKIGELFKHSVETCTVKEKLNVAIQRMHQGNYSQIPVCDDTRIIDLLTTDTIARWLSVRLAEDGILEDEPVENVLAHREDFREYEVRPEHNSIFDALEMFEMAQNRGKPLDAIIMTRSGARDDIPTGIVTPTDIPTMYSKMTFDL